MELAELPTSRCEARSCRKPQTRRFKRILVAVDHSPQAEYAVDAAVKLASQLDAEIVLTHICALPLPAGPTNSYVTPELCAVCMDAGEALLKCTRARLPASLQVSVELRQGHPADEVLKAARFLDADLIVLGTHARGRVTEAIMGSVARTVMQNAQCPVMTVAHPMAKEPACAASGQSSCCKVAVN
jgi:nucleotide-binding universal stress UspA family protein